MRGLALPSLRRDGAYSRHVNEIGVLHAGSERARSCRHRVLHRKAAKVHCQINAGFTWGFRCHYHATSWASNTGPSTQERFLP